MPKSKIKNEERTEIDTPYTDIHNRSFSRLGTDTSIKGGGFKLVLRVKIRTSWRFFSIFPHHVIVLQTTRRGNAQLSRHLLIPIPVKTTNSHFVVLLLTYAYIFVIFTWF
jgi:hypothetical protein